jgi:pyruvate/2-oxoglutarate dehydrogenase complex dihydrolipoamide acyltransferase (E2) component
LGDPVTVHEPLVEIDTDNETHEIRAPVTGVLSEVVVKDGGTVEPGTVLGMIDRVWAIQKTRRSGNDDVRAALPLMFFDGDLLGAIA